MIKINKRKEIFTISTLIVILSSIATSVGILSDFGGGQYPYESIRGETIEIYGRGIYQHMSADVAIQGITQDYVTLFIAIPLLLISLVGVYRAKIQALFLLAGTLGYFFVTYLFYTAMGMYNILFLVYVILLSLSFFGLFLSLQNLFQLKGTAVSWSRIPFKFVGWFLLVNSVLIGLLWFSEIIPPLLDGTIYPALLEHYTTLIVQGFDLGLLLPACFVTGLLLLKKKFQGLVYGTTYVVFLAILMSALTAKIIAMGINGVNIFPVIFIIPTINIITIFTVFYLLKSLKIFETIST